MARVTFWTLAASSRAALMDLIETHRDLAAVERVRTLAWTQAQVQLRHLDMTPAMADLFQQLAGHVIFAAPTLRAGSATIEKGAGPQPLLWEQGSVGRPAGHGAAHKGKRQHGYRAHALAGT
ncbi:hypothetical protein RAA17_11215 [Komagataeibacter rhaeticus]|nr:hypothetical protein [Komagataeibacter rhaeticus]